VTEEQTTLLVEQQGPLLILTLNRPDRLNALNRTLQRSLEEQYRRAERDPDIRVVIITGTGRAFCSGADVGHLQNQTGKSIQEQLEPPPKFTMRMAKVFKPTICAVNGICAGAGLHFVADSDIVIASENASFVDTHVNVGQVTALEPIGLLQRMSLTKVLRMVILGKAERLSAAQALECEMISEVVPPENLLARAIELGQIAAAVSPAAVQTSLRAIWNSLELPLAQAYEEGFEALIRHRAHPDAKEGPAAFLAKRPPKWSPP
jgi:enoyl-CoA hydratase/carnithine racemase